MQIVIYCQYVWGMGHLFRSLELARAFEPHAVTVLAGGQPVDIDLPAHVEIIRLPTLYMDEKFTRLISGEPNRDVESVKRERLDILQKRFFRALLCQVTVIHSRDLHVHGDRTHRGRR